MELDLEKVKEYFTLYSGEATEGDGLRPRLCALLCRECTLCVQRLFTAKETEEEWQEGLENWAAAEAFYQLTLADEASVPESVTADGVEIREGERSRKARALAEEKRNAVRSVLGEEDFYFGRV